ncbi:hypothetical protein P280DRAFT_171540 [Massarina eburnea CBS 473.64]|uniref:Uncharacterized protein n=1 Tax=Massarina eburnea CBS 473.64 TaxID=1395130 RepID=A0A6A6S995_9PLEO|nr:hypothetical protein P280DRAFT_171540 [Massarina eburnea CBS 473.64]
MRGRTSRHTDACLRFDVKHPGQGGAATSTSSHIYDSRSAFRAHSRLSSCCARLFAGQWGASCSCFSLSRHRHRHRQPHHHHHHHHPPQRHLARSKIQGDAACRSCIMTCPLRQPAESTHAILTLHPDFRV